MKRNFTIFAAFVIALFMMIMSQSVYANAVSDSAKSAVVIDAFSGEILYESNAYERLPMASTTKIMSALLALESGNLDEEFVVDSEAIKVEGSSMGLEEGDTVTMRALVCGMLLPSGNDAANAAAVRASGSVEDFVELMNERAQQIGLEDTHFVTPSGLDDDTDEHYSTAYDMACLAAYALQNEDFAQICSQRYIKLSYGNPPYERWLTNSNKLLDSVDGVIGVKTGFTDKAKRCLVSACERDGATLICVTLNDPDDWADHAALYDYAFELMEEQQLPKSGESFKLKVAGGEKSLITASTKEALMTLPSDALEHLKASVCIEPFAFAPISEGDKVGSVKYYYDDKLIYELDITADEDVSAKEYEYSGFDRIYKKLKRLLDGI